MVFTEMLMCKIPFPYYVCPVTLAKVIIESFEYVRMSTGLQKTILYALLI